MLLCGDRERDCRGAILAASQRRDPSRDRHDFRHGTERGGWRGEQTAGRAGTLSRLAWPKTDFRIHSVPLLDFQGGGRGKNGIPSLDEPDFVSVEAADEWLSDQEPVEVVDINGDVRAYPLQILIWHEIVNDVVGGKPVAVTYCPLCNSASVFDRTVDGQLLEFGTTGLLRFANLVMYDRQTESWWQEVNGEEVVGDLTGTKLEALPAPIIAWEDFKAAHPTGKVLSKDTGFDKPYGENPFYRYDTLGGEFLYDFSNDQRDRRLPLLERVVAISIGEEALAVPYSVLETEPVVHYTLSGQDLVVFFMGGAISVLDAEDIVDGREIGSTGVFDPQLDGRKLTFQVAGDGIVDDQTGSTWNILGRAISGPLLGQQLTAIPAQGSQIWMTWAVFRPDTVIYQGGGQTLAGVGSS